MPPVFVSTAPVDGRIFFMLAAAVVAVIVVLWTSGLDYLDGMPFAELQFVIFGIVTIGLLSGLNSLMGKLMRQVARHLERRRFSPRPVQPASMKQSVISPQGLGIRLSRLWRIAGGALCDLALPDHWGGYVNCVSNMRLCKSHL